MASLKPLSDYVVATVEAAETKTASGLYLPENAAEKPKTAKVVAIGKDVKQVKVGDRVVYGGYTNSEIKLDGQAYLLIREADILATVEGK